MEHYRILIDTDIGGDVDDALALAMALNTPNVEIVGITNVYLANAWRAGVTKELLRVYGREQIPVCAGAEKPLIGWWDDACPVRVEGEGAADVKATVYRMKGKAVIAVCNFGKEKRTVSFKVDWKALGLDAAKAKASIPEIVGVQKAADFDLSAKRTFAPDEGAAVLLKEEK